MPNVYLAVHLATGAYGSTVVEVAGPDGLRLCFEPGSAAELGMELLGHAMEAEQERELNAVLTAHSLTSREVVAILTDLRTARTQRNKS